MITYLARRFFLLLITLLITSTLIFTLTWLIPGDIVVLSQGGARDLSEQARAAIREDLGLNDSAPQQYLNWLGSFLRGDWGESFNRGSAPVRPLVLEKLGNTLRLAALTLAISIPLSILLGVIAALRENTWIDSLISVFSLAVVGLPEFVTSLVLINVFAHQLDWLPATSRVQDGYALGDWLRILILPAITATFVLLGYVARMTRAGVIDELKKPYVRTVTLKGLPRRQIVFKHVLRNALLPTITVIAISIGWLIGGLVVIEQVFNYPGLGRELFDSIEAKNIPIVQSIVMIIVLAFSLANLGADLLYAMLNPRIRLR
jgi:peptide/nickel transport system permease protein